MQTPKISLVIPTHRRKTLLRELLLSLQHQTLERDQFEVIVVVDGETDDTWNMLQEMDLPYKLRPAKQRQSGASATRNHGARLAEGDILVFLDDDMLPGKRFLEEHLRMHQAHPRAVILGAYVPPPRRLAEEQGGWNVWEARVLERHYREVACGRRPPAGRRLYSGNFSVGREDFWRVGGFDEDLARGEDVELGFRLEREGLSYHYGQATTALHRGFRSFESWRRSAYLYGQCDAIFERRKGHGVIPEVMGWYHHQRPAARLAVRLCMGRPWLLTLVLWCLTSVSRQLTKRRWHALAHYGYSGIYKLHYWRGFVEELGGPAAFEEQAAAWRSARLERESSDHKSVHPA